MLGLLAVTWGMLGVWLLLGSAIVRLTPIGLSIFSMDLSWYHWLVLAVWVVGMAHREGYVGFQKGFSPRVAARLAYLRRNPTPLRTILAPFFCMGYFDIERRRQIVVIGVTLMVISFIVIARQLPQPWRGIVDLGVVVGLLWGVIALLIFTVMAFAGRLRESPMLPERQVSEG
jgi:hypothetical protein